MSPEHPDTPGDALRAAVIAAVGAAPSAPSQWRRAGGSALNATWQLTLGSERFFVKFNDAGQLAMLHAEAAGLEELARAAVLRVPRPVAHGAAAGAAFLALEWLDLARDGRDAPLGRALAALHRVSAPRFGWSRDNTIGTTPQANVWHADWAVFWRDHRLAPQLARAAESGQDASLVRKGERLLLSIPALLRGHTPSPSLLHGDLWSGNAARLSTGEPVVFDPAVYFGDRETDLAMTELFGGFDATFYAAYRDAWPLDTGYGVRRTLYNLYHVLNHFNLFGGGYAAQASRMIEVLQAEAG